jgi:hypothetical protein
MTTKCVKGQHASGARSEGLRPGPERKHVFTEADQVQFRRLLLEASNAFFAAVETQHPEDVAVCLNQIDATASALRKALQILDEFNSP